MPSTDSSVASSSRLSPQVVRRGAGSTSSRRNSSTRTSPEQHRVPVGPPPALSPSLPRPSRVGSFATASSMPFQQLGSRRRPREESVTQSEQSSEDEEQGIFSTTTASTRRHRQSAKRQRVAIPVTAVEDDEMDSSTQDEEPPDPGPSRGRQQAARPISRVLQQQTAPDATHSSTQDEESSTEHGPLPLGPSSSRRSRAERRSQPPNCPRANLEPIVIGSSDEEEEDADAEMRTLEPTRTARRSTASHAGPVSSGFMVERIVRGLPPFSPQPVVASGSNDSLEIISATTKDRAAPPGQLHKLQASPPRRRPPPIAHPLLSTYTCPICLCAPFPNAVATPCGHVFCSECLFEALQHPIKQKETERREQASAFASIPTINRLGGFIGAGVAQAMGIAAYGGPGGASRAAGHGQNMAAALGLSGAPAPPTSIHLTLDSQGNTISSSSTTPGTAASPSAATSSSSTTTSSSTNNQQQAPPAPPQKLDPLVGPCPVCRAVIPGGFVAASLPANKRSAFGLELKIGKPIDDPRREEIQKR